MGRSPCCEKVGLKKGPWTSEEDELLVSYLRQHEHTNWHALSKQAGLLRCGKSCRLRWTNYLKPDIKRGNFTREEVDTIINSHQMLGNRWSVIAVKLPGRTDNEIKNFWHTHLKKRLIKQTRNDTNLEQQISTATATNSLTTSSQPSSSSDEFCTPTDRSSINNDQGIIESNSYTVSWPEEYPLGFSATNYGINQYSHDDSMEFWYNLFIKAGGTTQLSDF